jgi:hypothetical protein
MYLRLKISPLIIIFVCDHKILRKTRHFCSCLNDPHKVTKTQIAHSTAEYSEVQLGYDFKLDITP